MVFRNVQSVIRAPTKAIPAMTVTGSKELLPSNVRGEAFDVFVSVESVPVAVPVPVPPVPLGEVAVVAEVEAVAGGAVA